MSKEIRNGDRVDEATLPQLSSTPSAIFPDNEKLESNEHDTKSRSGNSDSKSSTHYRED